MTSKKQVGQKMLWVALMGLCVAAFAPGNTPPQAAKAFPKEAMVYVHPVKLTSKDKLTDGGKGNAITITTETTLIWVDLSPNARFSHPTEYILISATGSRVVKGQWWPVLNGKRLFGGNKPYKVAVPVQLTGK